jgi:hypothetical protein
MRDVAHAVAAGMLRRAQEDVVANLNVLGLDEQEGAVI